MVKKILLTITCGVVAVSMCACASGAMMFNEVQDAVNNELGGVNNLLNGDLNELLEGNLDSLIGGGTVSEEPETETSAVAEASAEDDTTEAALVEETEAAEEETPADAEEPEVALQEDETKVVLNEETTAAESETTVAASQKETTASSEKNEAEEDGSGKTEGALIAGAAEAVEEAEEIVIVLKKDSATADGKTIGTFTSQDIFISNDIVYYEDLDKYTSGNAYGEGTADDRHTEKEAAENAVLNITKAGTYRISGEWNGQIRVDLGDDAKTDKTAKVALILDGAKVTCTVAPAILFQNVYECDAVDAEEGGNSSIPAIDFGKEAATDSNDTSDDQETAPLTEEELNQLFSILFGSGSFNLDIPEDDSNDSDVFFFDSGDDDDSLISGKKDDTAASAEETSDSVQPIIHTDDAGAVIMLAKDSTNLITGSHVAKIFDDSKNGETLVKQDGAVYSYMTLNIEAEDETGELNIVADKEGLCSERHLTINGGIINIVSADDGINANEDNVSIVAVNDGTVRIMAGTGEEGDAIDSNGWIAINGGNVILSANPAADSGLDSDCGTSIDGGFVLAFGSAMDEISEASLAPVMSLRFAEEQTMKESIRITDTNGKTVYEQKAEDDVLLSAGAVKFSGLVISTPEFDTGKTYYVYIDDVQLANTGISTGKKEDKPVPGVEIENEKPGILADEEIYSELEDIFDHFGISMEEVEEYLAEKDAKDSSQGGTVKPVNPFENSQSTQPVNPFDGSQNSNRPEPPQGNGPFGGQNGNRPDFQPGAAPSAADAAETASEPTKEFTMEAAVTTFIGVTVYEEPADTQNAAEPEKETTVSSTEETAGAGTGNETTEKEDAKEEETTVQDAAKDSGTNFTLPIKRSDKSDAGVKALPSAEEGRISANSNEIRFSLDEPEELASFYQMIRKQKH